MKYHLALTIVFNALLVWQNCLAAEVTRHEADVCVYGGTASGVMAALAAGKEGSKVILIEPTRWLGGMTGGGINHLDWGKGNTVGGSTYKILMEGLKKQMRGHRGNAIVGIGHKGYRERFKKAVEGRGITVIYNHRLGKVELKDSTIDSPTRRRPIAMGEKITSKNKDNSIRSITLDYAPVDETGCPILEPTKRNALTVVAKVFIDCSYEGDLLAMSGVNYTWGRESREHYKESLAGVRPSLWVHDIDPYVEPGNPESGLVPFVEDHKIGPLGSADSLSMGYGYRYEFDMSGKGIPIPEPKNYDPAEFELYRRALIGGIDIFSKRKMDTLGKITLLKRSPTVGSAQSNRNLMASTVYGCNKDYPNGDWATRSRIWKFHQEFLINSIHFAKTDPSAPESMRRHAKRTSFRKGVFDETGGWPNQLYVRQARRMVSSYIVTQKDLEGKTDPPHAVGLAAYGVDDWPYAVVVKDGKVAVQGGEFSIVYLDDGKYNGSYKIPYEAIVPRKGECDNLVVPVCVSASHIAFTSIRMEPVWMNLGESAGVAAAMAVDASIPVQDVPYNKLRQKLEDLDQKLDREQPGKSANSNSARWKSQDEWNQQKKGWEWLFPHIDTDSDGQISAEEYKAFQKFKAEHDDWEESLKKKEALTPASLLPRDKPNIVLIFADDLGIEALNAYGGRGVKTPHLDKLATGGMLFTHCFANPACSPSRAELLTGTYPRFNGIQHVLSKWKDDTYLNPKKFNSFANQLKEVGYATAIAGKWNLSWLERNDTVKALGFDEHCLWQMYDRNGVKRSRFYKPYFRINGKVEEASITERFGPDVLTDFMIDFMKRKKDEPFLIYYPALLVHTPYIRVPGGPKTNALPDNKQKSGPECFPEMVEYLDKNVGRLMNAVDELGIRKNTMFVFCADNGAHGPVASIWGENRTKIKGGKMTMTDRGSRVPLLVSWPGKVNPGSQCDDLVELADFLPTFLDLAAAPEPIQRVRGQSFLPQLLGKEGPSKEWVHIEYKQDRQIRTKEWIYTNKGNLIKVNELGRPENRPEKQTNHSGIRKEMKRIFDQIEGERFKNAKKAMDPKH
jgi:arylsulfatase A-like enzyme|tara:strand:- start:402 stop:3617 length:3216 start_codon:yes stop_codon:yes gene_type:complete